LESLPEKKTLFILGIAQITPTLPPRNLGGIFALVFAPKKRVNFTIFD